MNIDNLEIGKEHRNYAELCKVLGVAPKRSNSKISQVAMMDRYFKCKKNGHKIIVEEIYSSPLPKKENKRNKKLNIQDYKRRQIQFIHNSMGHELKDLYVNSKEKLTWRCEKCSALFIDRVDRVLRYDSVKCNNCTLSVGARYIQKLLMKESINVKSEISFDKLVGNGGSLLRFDFGIYNYNNVLLGIVEYDGGFHDSDLLTQEHDAIKNKYCHDNNIPLLRIHHTDKYVALKLFRYLVSIECEMILGHMHKEKNKEISIIESKVRVLNEHISKIENKKKELEGYLE